MTTSTQAQSANQCYMVNSAGRRIDLSSICAKPAPPAPVRPKPVPQASQSAAAVAPTAQPRLVQSQPTYYSQPTDPDGLSINIRAFLKVIRYAEGTDNEYGYITQFGYNYFLDFRDHPRQVKCTTYKGRELCSSAAGAYQFLDTTWDQVAAAIGASDFRPFWQDWAAVQLIYQADALEDVQAGRIDQAIVKTSHLWASFPRSWGDTQGQYDQPVKAMEDLVQQFYQQQQIEAAQYQRLAGARR